MRVARASGYKVVFDAAHAFGCMAGDKPIGRFGDAEVFSFHGTKFLNAFEGGAVVTNDERLAKTVRLMTNFGFAGYDDVVYVGTNGKMNEASAAMGLTSLESCEEFITVNRRNYDAYQREFADVPGVRLIEYPEQERSNYQYVIIEVDSEAFRLSRDELRQVLWAENILVRRYFYPGCHRMQPYRSLFPRAGLVLPATEALVERTLCLPTGTSFGVSEVRAICGLIRFASEHAAEVRRRLERNQRGGI